MSLPATLSVAEGDGVVTVCVTLESGAIELTQREFTVTLMTMGGSGKLCSSSQC